MGRSPCLNLPPFAEEGDVYIAVEMRRGSLAKFVLERTGKIHFLENRSSPD
jgi:hypothetical protein